MARPTKLTPELIENAKRYIEDCSSDYKITYKPTVNKDGELRDMPEVKYDVNLPTVEGLAYELAINRDTVYSWCKDNKEFSDIIDDLKAKQAKFLINKGLSGEYNPTIAKVLLSKHGYSERIETDVTTGGEKITMTPEHLAITKRYEEELNRIEDDTSTTKS